MRDAKKAAKNRSNYYKKTAIKFSKNSGSIILQIAQRNKCAICKNKLPVRFHVDHCHNTKKVRGILCGSCNIGIGNFKENIKSLKGAIAYLARANKKQRTAA